MDGSCSSAHQPKGICGTDVAKHSRNPNEGVFDMHCIKCSYLKVNKSFSTTTCVTLKKLFKRKLVIQKGEVLYKGELLFKRKLNELFLDPVQWFAKSHKPLIFPPFLQNPRSGNSGWNFSPSSLTPLKPLII